MAKSVVIIGLGRFGLSVARNLFQLKHDVLGLDTDEKVVHESMGLMTYSVLGDATNETTLKELGVSNFDAAIVAVASDMQVSLMASVLLANLGVPLIVARANDELHATALKRLGVHKIIYPEREMGESLARSMFNPDVLEYMDLSADSGISKIEIPDSLAESTFREAGFGGAREEDGVVVLAIRRAKDVILRPRLDEKIQKGDLLVVGGKDAQLEELEKLHHANNVEAVQKAT